MSDRKGGQALRYEKSMLKEKWIKLTYGLDGYQQVKGCMEITGRVVIKLSDKIVACRKPSH